MARSVSQRRGKVAFTMLELLSVIVIIVIFCSITMPIVRSIQSRCYRTVSVSNLHQTFHALSLYVNDYDDCVPFAVDICDVRGLCSSKVNSDYWFLIKSVGVPSYNSVLSPYGFNSDLLFVNAGTGPNDYVLDGSNYYPVVRLSYDLIARYQAANCPFVLERRSYFSNGGKFDDGEPSVRRLTLSFSGNVIFEQKDIIFERAEACRISRF